MKVLIFIICFFVNHLTAVESCLKQDETFLHYFDNEDKKEAMLLESKQNKEINNFTIMCACGLFIQPKNFKRHKKLHVKKQKTKMAKYVCHFCKIPSYFVHQGALTKHIKDCHPSEFD